MALELSSPYTVQQAVTSSTIEITEAIDSMKDQTVRAMVSFLDSEGEITERIWLDVWGPEEYNLEWTQADLEAKVIELLSD